MKLNAKQLRALMVEEDNLEEVRKQVQAQRKDLYIILDNVLDTYNIGSVFRLADGVGAKKVLLCRGSETPPNHRIKKASINTTEWVDWQYFESTTTAIETLRREVPGIQVVAVELTDKAVPYDTFDYHYPVAVIVGHETDGVSQDAIDLCDATVQLPMNGINISLNVMVSLAIVLYKVLEKAK